MTVDSMEIDDSVFIHKDFTIASLIPRAKSHQRKQPSRCLSVCVGLALVVLLASVVGQAVYYGAFSRRLVDQLRSTNASLHDKRKELHVRVKNLTEELKLQLERLNVEREVCLLGLNALKSERDLLRTIYNESRREASLLRSSAADAEQDLRELQSNCSRMRATAERLQADKADLQRRNMNLSASLEKQKKSQAMAEANRASSAARFRDLYALLQSDKEELNGSCQILQREMKQLQSNYSLLAAAKDRLREQLVNLKRDQGCQLGWRKLNESCYFFSTLTKNWTLSRQHCKSKGGDLVVINSKEEQAFINQLIPTKSHVWIGLSDILEEGTWTWVDGTPLTITLWYPGQPNSQGDQDCVELVQDSSKGGLWNDEYCNQAQTWICEK